MSKKSPTEENSKHGAHKINAVPEGPTIGECEQNIDNRLEFLHDLLLATSTSKLVKLLGLFPKNRVHFAGGCAGPELGCERIRIDVLPRLSGVLDQGSVKDSPKLRCQCVWMGMGGHDVWQGDNKTRASRELKGQLEDLLRSVYTGL